MAGSVKSVIAENGLQVSDATHLQRKMFPQAMRLQLPQLIRCRGYANRSGYYVATYGQSVREAVNKWLDWNN